MCRKHINVWMLTFPESLNVKSCKNKYTEVAEIWLDSIQSVSFDEIKPCVLEESGHSVD